MREAIRRQSPVDLQTPDARWRKQEQEKLLRTDGWGGDIKGKLGAGSPIAKRSKCCKEDGVLNHVKC